MNEKRTRMRVKSTDDGDTEVFVLVSHPMETGLRISPETKKNVPAHFIKQMTFLLNGKEITAVDLGPAVSRDPLITVRMKTKAGDKIKVIWNDNHGVEEQTEFAMAEGS